MKKILVLFTALALLIIAHTPIKADETDSGAVKTGNSRYEVVQVSDSTTKNIISNSYGSVKVKFNVSGSIAFNNTGDISFTLNSYNISILNWTFSEPTVTLQGVSVVTSSSSVTVNARVRVSWGSGADVKTETLSVVFNV